MGSVVMEPVGTSYTEEQMDSTPTAVQRKKRALVTGHKGFVGRHLVPLLEAAGYEVFGTEFFAHFLLDYRAMVRYDVVVHLGANIVNIDDRMKMGMKAYDDISLDQNVCDYVEHYPPTEAFIVMSSCAVDYPDDPYCIVKRTLEAFAMTLFKRGVPVVILRPFSGYGPDQSEEYPFRAIFERALQRKDPLTVWGGSQIRDWVHIGSLCDAIIWAIDRFPRGVPIEVGTGIGTSLAVLAQMIASRVGYAPQLDCDKSKEQSSSRRVANAAHTTSLTGWQSRVSLADGISRAVDYFRKQGRLK